MADVLYDLRPASALFQTSSFPQYLKNAGTNGPVEWLAYDAAATESAYWELEAFGYPGSAPDVSVAIVWGAATATSGVVRWEVALAAITPETDTQDPETKSYGTAVTVDDTHLGTTAKRLMRATVTLSGASLNSLAGEDEVWVRVSRIGGNAADTLTGDAWLKKVRLSYSDS